MGVQGGEPRVPDREQIPARVQPVEAEVDVDIPEQRLPFPGARLVEVEILAAARQPAIQLAMMCSSAAMRIHCSMSTIASTAAV